MVLIKYILASLSTKEKVELFKRLYKEIAGMGINGDTELAHINKDEGAILKMMGGAGTINEATGLIQYFGGSPPPPPAASSTVTQQQTIPDEMKPYITDVLTQSQALNKQRTEEGYQPYQGAQIADFQPEQTQAQTGIAGLVGSGQQYFDKAANLTEQAGQAPTAEAMQSYMSPYMQNVVDIQKREALRQGDVAAQGQAYGATQAGAFGGSRDAIVQAENERNQQTLLNDIQAKGSAAAYADAQQQYAAQQKNALAAGAQYGQLGSAVPGQAMKEFGALESVGAAKQQQEQQALNLAKQQFIQEQTFPEANLQQYSSIIRGYNLPPNTYQSAQTVTPAPSYMQQIAGLGMAGAGIAGAFGNFGGKKEGGLVGLAKGGKVLRRGNGGLTQQEGFSELSNSDLQKLLGDPDYSPTLIKQELEKRYAAERGVQDNTPDATRRTTAGRFNVDTAFPSGGLAELANQKGISAYDKNEAEYEAPSTFGRHVGALGKFSADITQKPAKGLYDYFMKPEKDPKVAAEEKRGISAILAQQNNPEQAGNTLESQEAEAAAPAPTTPTAPAAVKPPKEAEGIEGPGRKPVPPLLGQKKQGEDDTQKKPGTNWDDLRAKALTLGDDALAAQDKIREELGGKLDAADEKKKGILGKRKENLDSQKWMALAEMGASVLAQPGGQTFLQSLGKGAKESGILGTLSKLGDKAYDIETDLADMDVKTAVSKYGLSKDQYDAVIKNRDSQTRRLEAVDTGQFREGQIKLGSERNENDLTIAGIRAQAATDKLASQQRENDSKAAYREQVIENLQYKSDTDSIKALGALEDNLRTKEAIAKMLSGIPENKPKTRAYLQEKLDKAKSGGKAGSVPINAVGTAGESENKTP